MQACTHTHKYTGMHAQKESRQDVLRMTPGERTLISGRGNQGAHQVEEEAFERTLNDEEGSGGNLGSAGKQSQSAENERLREEEDTSEWPLREMVQSGGCQSS